MQSVRAMMDECRAAESCKAPSLAAAVSLWSENAQLAPGKNQRLLNRGDDNRLILGFNFQRLVADKIFYERDEQSVAQQFFLEMSERCHFESETVEFAASWMH